MVKTTRRTMYTLLRATLVLTACVRSDKGLSQPRESGKAADLVIPDDTNWTTTRSVNLSIISPVATRMTIHTDESYTDASLLTELPVSEIAGDIRLDAAKADRVLYVQYATSKGRETMNIPLNAASMHAGTLIKLSEDTSGSDIDGGEGVYRYRWYPVRGGAVILMMEDNWPEMRDYDFGDFVIWYHTQAIFFNDGNGSKGSYKVDGIEFETTFHAMGGYPPYRLGLQLDQTPARYIDETIEVNRNDPVRVELQSPRKDAPTVFMFTDTDQSRKQSNGGTFYNTEASHQIAINDLVTIRYRLKINCFNSLKGTKVLWTTAISENQNFFLQEEGNGRREIHLRSYESIAYHSDSCAGETGSGMRNDIRYCSTDNFVWGIKAPVKLAYPREKKDIMEVYGKFRGRIINPNLSPNSSDFNENRSEYLDSS